MIHRNEPLHCRIIPMLITGLGVKKYLEFGVCDNESLAPATRAILANQGTAIGVDIRQPPYAVHGAIYKIMSTADYLASHAAADGPFDMVFIDADHNEAAVAADFLGIWPHVVDDGLVLMHDGNPGTLRDVQPGYCNDAWKAIRKITESHEAVTLPYHPGLTIVRKRALWGPAPSPLPADRDSAERS